MFDSSFSIASSNGNFKVEYTTTTGKTYPLEIGFSSIPSGLVPVDAEATIKACRNGCSLYGRNGGCPPFSKKFSKIRRNHFLILYAKMLTEFYPPKVLNGCYYTRWVFVETFLTSLTNRIGKKLAFALDGYFLSSGYCCSCKPKRCSVKDGKPCRKPDARTYSLEATGILVTELMKDVFDIELQWWRPKEPDYVPKYMLKVIGLTREKDFNSDETKGAIISALKGDRIVAYEYNAFAKSSSLLSTKIST
jgi:predicted metal-binding protein